MLHDGGDFLVINVDFFGFNFGHVGGLHWFVSVSGAWDY